MIDTLALLNQLLLDEGLCCSYSSDAGVIYLTNSIVYLHNNKIIILDTSNPNNMTVEEIIQLFKERMVDIDFNDPNSTKQIADICKKLAVDA